jgi:acetyl-CoA carboxylase biotin carboxylase subunit
LNKLLIANRGEIAVRVIRTCRDMGISTVAVYSQCDRNALHVRLADEAYAIGPDRASESYLRIDKLIDVARQSKARFVHPGYGFLAENPEFAEACERAGLTFVGPDARAMRAMGNKTAARDIAVAAGVPVVPGGDAAADVGFPLLVKAVAGGGGKGMRVVGRPEELESAVRLARSEALSAFGDDRVYFERRLDRPRHIEVQLLGDRHGTVVPFVERECSIQRRHQKLVEETPSPSVSPELRKRLLSAAAAIGRAANYANAGTIEFLVDVEGNFYFLEMNTRLQVEHPVTEAVTGIDFVRAQIEIARGGTVEEVLAGLKPCTPEVGRGSDVGGATDVGRGGTNGQTPVALDFGRAVGGATGHAIEVRIYAENPYEGFLPSPGVITHLRAPAGPGIRDDSGAYSGWKVPSAYDALISKVIAWGPDRPGAISRMVRALAEYDVRGISTTIGFCRDLIASPAFASGEFDTTYVDRLLDGSAAKPAPDEHREEIAAIGAALWEAARLKSSTTADKVSSTTGDKVSEKKGSGAIFTGDDSLWAQRARLEALR